MPGLALGGDELPPSPKLRLALQCVAKKRALEQGARELAALEDRLAKLCDSGDVIDMGEGECVLVSQMHRLDIVNPSLLHETLGSEAFGELVCGVMAFQAKDDGIGLMALLTDADHPRQEALRQSCELNSEWTVGYVSVGDADQ